MSNNDWNFALPDSLLHTMAEFNKIQLSASALAMSSTLKSAVSIVSKNNLSEISAAMKDYSTMSRVFSGMTISTNALLGLTDAINALQIVKTKSVVESIIPLIDTSAFSVIKDASTLTALTRIDWCRLPDDHDEHTDVQDKQNNEDSIIEIIAEDVPQEIRVEIAADVTQVLSNPNQAQELSKSKYEKWKERHPILADIYLQVILPIVKDIVHSVIIGGLAIIIASPNKDTVTPTQPQSVVYNITLEQNITIVDEQQDYYVVEFLHPETGEQIKGYIIKGKQDSTNDKDPVAEAKEKDLIEESELETTMKTDPNKPSE